jgi:PilZ domain
VADKDKRDSERIDLLGLLQGEVKIFQPTAVRQMSRGGMQIETRFALQLDALHEFRLTIGEQSVVLRGRVVHSHISEVDQDVVTYVTGVEFIELSPHATTVINEFLELLRLARFKN